MTHTIPTKILHKEHFIQPPPFSFQLSRVKLTCKSFINYICVVHAYTPLSYIPKLGLGTGE